MPTRARSALLGAAAGVALLIVTWYAAFHVGVFQRADHAILRGFSDLQQHPRVNSIASFIANLCDPDPFVYFAAVPVLIAVMRRRPRVAVAIVAILLGANVTTQLLKPLLAAPRPDSLLAGTHASQASWPSGHATAAMSLALCLVLAAPSRLRPFAAAAGAAFAVAVSYSFLTLEWHYPSDVFGGFLVAGAWTLLGVAAVFAADARAPQPGRVPPPPARQSTRDALAPPAGALLAALALVALVALARPHAVVSYARAHEAFVIGAATIGALALVLATGVMLALRR